MENMWKVFKKGTERSVVWWLIEGVSFVAAGMSKIWKKW